MLPVSHGTCYSRASNSPCHSRACNSPCHSRAYNSPCLLRVGVIGMNFKTADLPLRETMARGAQKLEGEKGLFFQYPTVLLSTCNRTEIYFHAEDLAQAHSDLLSLLRDSTDESFDHRLYSYFGIDCFAHLCRVASGLDSAILAETEIQRQVKVAYAKSSSYFLPGSLHYIFQKALKVGKSVRNQLELEKGAPTLHSALWQISESILGNLSAKRILLVGYSEINRGFASFLLHKGIKTLSFITKNPSSVCFDPASIYGREELERWREYDLIVCASKSDHYLIEGSSEKEHLIFDLSVPRTVDPKVGNSLSVQLFNIEQVNQRIEQQRRAQTECLEKCETLVWENVVRLARIYREKGERLKAKG